MTRSLLLSALLAILGIAACDKPTSSAAALPQDVSEIRDVEAEAGAPDPTTDVILNPPAARVFSI